MSATAAVGTQTTTTTGTAGGKLGAIAGLTFAFLFFMGTAMLNIPRGTSDAKLVAWWADSGNQTMAVVSMYFFAVAGIVFLLFLAKLRSRLLVGESGTGELTSLVVASGAVFVAMLLVAAAVAIATTSWIIVRTAVFGRWLAWVGALAAILVVVASFSLVGMLAIPAMLVWVLAVSVAMWRGAR